MIIDPEDQVAADIAAAEARGEDPYADKPQAQPDDASGEASPEPVAEKEEATPAKEVAEPAPEAPVETIAEASSAPPTSFQTAMPADYKVQRTELIKEKAALMKKLMDGELDSDEFAVEESRISDALEDLMAQRIRAETLQEANVQTQAMYQQREIQKLIASTRNEVDYVGDAKAQRQFDMALGLVGQDSDNMGKSYADLLGEAHKVVLAMRGIARAAATEQAKAPAERPARQGAQPPQTLSGLPTAASSGAKSVERTLAELSGDELERAFDALPKGEFERLLKS